MSLPSRAKKVSLDNLGVLENSEQVFVEHSKLPLVEVLRTKVSGWDWISVSKIDAATCIPCIAFYIADLQAIGCIKTLIKNSTNLISETPVINVYITALLINNIIFFNDKYPTKNGFEFNLETDSVKQYKIMNKFFVSGIKLKGHFDISNALYYCVI